MPHQSSEPSKSQISEIIAAHMALEGPLLPILHAMQHEFGHVPQAAVPLLADALNIGKAEVHGVISFYHDFRDAPAGRHVVKICRAEACKSMGGDAMAEGTLAKLGLEWHGTTSNGAITIEPVYCLGLCACAPAAMVDGKLMGRATTEKLTAAIKGATA